MADFLNSTGLTQVLQAVKRAVPTTLAALSDDATHRLVTDTEKSAWNNKVSNVQADWNATSGLAQILNKPAVPTKISELVDDVVSGKYLPLSGGEMSPSAEISFGMPNFGYTKVSYGGISVYNGGYFDGIKVEVTDPNADGGVGGIYVTDENLHGYFKNYDYTFPKKTGTVALISDIPATVTESTVSGWGYIKSYTETDPIFSASAAAGITSANITTWNGKQDAISDLATIRSNASAGAAKVSANNSTITIQKGGINVDTFTTNAASNKTINIPNELPAYSSTDSNKVLSINSSGQLVWITPVSIYTGSREPDNSVGNDGDIYLQT